jgi:hypothetical protein
MTTSFRTVSVLAALLAGCGGAEQGGSKGSATWDGATAKLEMFVMSQCPYGVEVVNAIAPVKKQLGAALDLKVNYIGDGAPGSLNSMHGPARSRATSRSSAR